MKVGLPLSLRQALLEGARGAVKKAAGAYGDTPTAIRLWRLAHELKDLREPEVAAAYERVRLRSSRGRAGAANG